MTVSLNDSFSSILISFFIVYKIFRLIAKTTVMKRKQIRTKWLMAAMLSLCLTSFNVATHAADWYVATTGNNTTGNGTSGNPWLTISFAITSATSGDVIHIGTGQFVEQLEISKSLTLLGEGINQTTILSPAELALSFSASSPIGANYYAVINIHDANNVNIKSLTIDGNSLGDNNTVFLGVSYHNAGGLVDNCKIISIVNAPPYTSEFGYGLFALADNGINRNVTVSNSSFIIFQKIAVGFLGNNLTGVADGNVIEGAGPISSLAQNGVQISFNATGTVKDNKIKNISYEGYDKTATAILVDGARSPVSITGNEILDCQTGIYCIGGGGIIAQNKLIFSSTNYNAIVQYWWGILVRKGTYLIKENEIDGGGDGTGIDAFALANDKTIVTIINNILKNLETGISTEVDETPGCVTGDIHYNSITNTLEPLYNNQDPTTECPIPDAECNWLGSAKEDDFTSTDPTKPHIVGQFNYEPWLTNGTDQQPEVMGFQPLPDACGTPCINLEGTASLKETFPYTFNTGFYKSLANRTFTGSTGTWTVNSNENATMVVTTPYYSPSTSYALKVVNFKTYNCANGWAKAVSPKLNLTGPCCPENVKFNFTLWTYNVVCNDLKAKLEIDFSADNGVTWNEVFSKTSGQLWSQYGANGKVALSIPVPTIFQTANFRYRIRGEMEAGDNNNFYVFIDDIKFTSPTVCPPLGTIGDFVWKDVNANGKQDAGEPGIPNVTVKLLLPNANTLTKTTDANGGYLFTGLVAGNYSVTFTTPTGFVPTIANQGTDDGLDSDPVNGTVAVTLAAGQINKTIDAGFKVYTCTNTVSHIETFPNKFNTYFTPSLYNKTFVGSSGTWTSNSNSRGTVVVTTPYYSPSSSYALKVVNYNTIGCGAGWTKAMSPKVDLSNPCCPAELKMTFTLWTYKVVANDYKAKLEIDFSSNNGANWTEVWSKTSAQLHSSYGANGKTVITISVPLAYQNTNFRYRIRGEMEAGDCNNFYVFIDDIKIGSPAVCPTTSTYVNARTTGTEIAAETPTAETVLGTSQVQVVEEVKTNNNVEAKTNNNVIVFPNPSVDEFELRLSSKESTPATMRVVDMFGRVIKTMRIAANSSTRFGTEFKRGSYLVEIFQGDRKEIVKLVKL
ncbi:MAG: nitrous oxidase accessory protein [Flavisolibacter sp.]|nr:nitrous oxidase accessory protein [Flavisolibacter sp.]